MSTCRGCHASLTDEAPVCPACIEEQAIYQQWRARHKRMPRAFIGYAALLTAWKKRRDECRALRKETAAARREVTEARAELACTRTETAAAQLLLESDAGRLALEVIELRAKLRLTEEHLERARVAVLDAMMARGRGHVSPHAIPADMLKPLRALCHPDRWQGTPQQSIAHRVMQWLNGGER